MCGKTKAWLHDAAEACHAIRGFVSDMDFDSFLSDDRTRSAVERKFEILGEALRRIRDNDVETFGSIQQGHAIIGMRNRLIHGYDVVDEEIVWETIHVELVQLQSDLALLQSE